MYRTVIGFVCTGIFLRRQKVILRCDEIKKSLLGLPRELSTKRVLLPSTAASPARDALVFSFDSDPLSSTTLDVSDSEVKYYMLIVIRSDIVAGVNSIVGSQTIERSSALFVYSDITVPSMDDDRESNYTLMGRVDSISFGGYVVEGATDFPAMDSGSQDQSCSDTPSCATFGLVCNTITKTCVPIT